MRFKNFLRFIVIFYILICLILPFSYADSTTAFWTRVACFYNAGSGGYACDSGIRPGDSASCSARDGVECAVEGNVYCWSQSSCETHGETIAGPVHAYNVNWDEDSADCSCKVGGGRWNIGFESGTSQYCCGDDSNEYKRTRSAGTDSTYSSSSSDDACCTASNKCIYSSSCYSSGSTRGSIPSMNYCNEGTWQGGDAGSTQCTAIAGSSRWAIGGEISNCCGDDSGEYREVETQGYDAPSLFDDGTDACCNSNSDCVEYNSCYSNAATTGNIPNKGYCNSGSWQGGDAGSTQCSKIAGSSRWAIGGETASSNCCGDDSYEYKKKRSAGSLIFNQQYQNIALDDESALFKHSWIRFLIILSNHQRL